MIAFIKAPVIIPMIKSITPFPIFLDIAKMNNKIRTAPIIANIGKLKGRNEKVVPDNNKRAIISPEPEEIPKIEGPTNSFLK